MFLGVEPRDLFVDWEEQARVAVESLRLEAGNDPADRATIEPIAQLRATLPQTGRPWHQHRDNQRPYRPKPLRHPVGGGPGFVHGPQRLRHPVVGDLTVEYETLTLPGGPDITLYVYSTEPASPSARALDLLASWSLTGVSA